MQEESIVNVIPKYTKQMHVELRDLDFTKRLKLSALFTYLQDAAGIHAEKLGLGIGRLMEKLGVSWVLMRIRADITRYPEWDEEITIETWPLEPKRFEFERDFIVKDREGQIIVRAVSTWVVMDMTSRELKKGDFVGGYPALINERAIDCKLGKLRDYGQPEPAYRKTIGYSDVDFNGHLNNARYVDYLMDCFSIESHEQYLITSIEVSYINEALPGDSIMLSKDISALDQGKVYIEGLHEKDGRVVFKAQLMMAPREG
jgi:medium-chain acyl-[acyl-carrier-protein] hydrolase